MDTVKNVAGTAANTASNAARYVSETVQGTGAEASKEANQEVAKDNNASFSTRAAAAKDALGDKKDEVSHNAQANLKEEQLKR